MDTDRARELAEKRVDNALNALRLVGNLGRHGLPQADQKKISAALNEALKTASARLSACSASERKAFTLR